MIPSIVVVEPLLYHQLRLRFAGSELRLFNLTPWLDRGLFKDIKDSPALYKAVGISFDTVTLPNGVDLDPELLYEASVPMAVPAGLASDVDLFYNTKKLKQGNIEPSPRSPS